MKNTLKKCITLIICCVMMLCLAAPAFAEGKGIEVTLPSAYKTAGVKFSAYKIADTSLKLTPLFEKSGVKLTGGEKQLSEAAAALAAYAAGNVLGADASGVTDDNGTALISPLTDGVYLVTGDNVRLYSAGESKKYISPVPFIASIASGDTIVKAEAKTQEHEEKDEYTSLRVLKIWDDNNNPNRPQSVTVRLFGKDGDNNLYKFDEVVLNKANNWAYTWPKLNSGYDYFITEASVPDGYKYTLTRQQGTVALTNTLVTPTPTPTPGPGGNTPGGKLPQTGQLWWPVPALICLGLVFMASGVLIKKKGGDDE